MKKKGFTLVELLGIIVILGLLILLALPQISNVVKSSSSKTDAVTLNMILDAAKLYVDDNIDKYEKSNGITYCISLEELVNHNYLKSPIKLSDNSNIVTLKSVEVVYDNGFNYELKDTNKCSTDKQYKKYNNGQIIYYDVINGNTCNNYHLDNSLTGYNGTNLTKTTDNQNSCLKFYVFNDDAKKNSVNLLLDHNTTDSVVWSSDKTTASGPKELLEQLKSDTSSWSGVLTPTAYSIDQSSQESGISFTVDYTGYNARLLSVSEIAQITLNTSWDEITSTQQFYFDSNTTEQSDTCTIGTLNTSTGFYENATTSGCKYGWLYDRTGIECTKYGCLNNSEEESHYWLITPYSAKNTGTYRVLSIGKIARSSVSTSSGIRPVIEVLKSKL